MIVGRLEYLGGEDARASGPRKRGGEASSYPMGKNYLSELKQGE